MIENDPGRGRKWGPFVAESYPFMPRVPLTACEIGGKFVSEKALALALNVTTLCAACAVTPNAFSPTTATEQRHSPVRSVSVDR